MAKETKTQIELAVAIMNKIREYPEVASEIKAVEVRRAERHNPKASNWDAIFEMLGFDSSGRPVPMMTPHPLAQNIVQELQGRFDLA